jgi:hypothetical protein
MIAPGAAHGLVGAVWYLYVLPSAAGGAGGAVTLSQCVKKAAMDTISTGFFMVPVDFVLNSLVKGKTWEEIKMKFKLDYCKALLISIIWFPIDIPMFAFVPLHLQPLTVKFLDFIYFVMLSFPINTEHPDPAALPKAEAMDSAMGPSSVRSKEIDSAIEGDAI